MPRPKQLENSKKGQYTKEEYDSAVRAVIATGTTKKASKECGIPESTIRYWLENADWWQERFSKIWKEQASEFIAKVTVGSSHAVDILIDRLQNGDPVRYKVNEYDTNDQGKRVIISTSWETYYEPLRARDVVKVLEQLHKMGAMSADADEPPTEEQAARTVKNLEERARVFMLKAHGKQPDTAA